MGVGPRSRNWTAFKVQWYQPEAVRVIEPDSPATKRARKVWLFLLFCDAAA